LTIVFTKLAKQLNADKLAELAVIPVIFVVQTMVSYLVSIAVSKGFGLAKRPTNFVTAMGVSLPNCYQIVDILTTPGIRKFEFPPDFARHFPIADVERIALG
jgi:hypothetical protein